MTLAGLRIQLGAGRTRRPGWLRVDISASHEPDIVADLCGAWPIHDQSVDAYEITHVLEHLPDPAHVIRELARTLAPGGTAEITVPHCHSPFAVADPTHLRFFNGLSMDYFAVAGGLRKLPGTYDHDLRLLEIVSRRYAFGGALGIPFWRLLGVERLASRFPLAFEKWFAWFPFGGCDVTWLVRVPSGD